MSSVKQRHVLFLGGFDPKGASWYHALYRYHGADQGTINGMQLEIGRRMRDAMGRAHWQVRSTTAEGEQCSATLECVSWDATVRRHWPRTAGGLLASMLRAYWRMFRHGSEQILKVYRIAPKTAFALLYPLLLFLAFVAVTATLMLGAGCLVRWASGSALAALLSAAGLGGLLAWAGLRLEKRLDTSLLARIFSFVSDYATIGIPDIDRTLAQAANRIAELVRTRAADEILVVGFSVGTILASRAMAQALELLGNDDSDTPALALLTLGNCIPLYGLYPQASAYRTELARLAQSDRLCWVDVSSPTDWGSFALLNPIEVCDIAVQHRGSGWPRMHSPRFHTLFGEESYRSMIRDKHRMHMQYLMSTERAGRYDYFAITAGPACLAQRYASAAVRRT